MRHALHLPSRLLVAVLLSCSGCTRTSLVFIATGAQGEPLATWCPQSSDHTYLGLSSVRSSKVENAQREWRVSRPARLSRARTSACEDCVQQGVQRSCATADRETTTTKERHRLKGVTGEDGKFRAHTAWIAAGLLPDLLRRGALLRSMLAFEYTDSEGNGSSEVFFQPPICPGQLTGLCFLPRYEGKLVCRVATAVGNRRATFRTAGALGSRCPEAGCVNASRMPVWYTFSFSRPSPPGFSSAPRFTSSRRASGRPAR